MASRIEDWAKRRLAHHPRLWKAARAARRRLRVPRGSSPTGPWDSWVSGVESGERRGWLDWELIEVEHIRPQVSGDRDVYYLEHFVATHLATLPCERALSLGCGGGNLERALLAMGAAREIDAYDASPESIRLARELARAAGLDERIHYHLADLNRVELPPAAYDYAVAKMALHHFERLEHVYEQVARALKPGGLFMFNEFVGPSRFQWTDLQLQLANQLLELIPAAQRRRAPLPRFERPSVRDVVEDDPTEAVRSAEILPLAERWFEIVEIRPYGGTLLNLLLTQMMPTFDLEDETEVAFLRLLFLFERTLVARRVVPSDFAYVVVRPR
jgi:SAM-dependent methyltransferase